MKEAPEPVLLYIPLMKDLGLSWEEIKKTPRRELEGILIAYTEYQQLHSLDGYNEKDISNMAKNKPEIRGQYARYLQKKRKYYKTVEEKKKSFKDLL
tara:strand:- start:3328 stop:3618 length:291 start_codon:yes stop_codon:yes gene_type:complete